MCYGVVGWQVQWKGLTGSTMSHCPWTVALEDVNLWNTSCRCWRVNKLNIYDDYTQGSQVHLHIYDNLRTWETDNNELQESEVQLHKWSTLVFYVQRSSFLRAALPNYHRCFFIYGREGPRDILNPDVAHHSEDPENEDLNDAADHRNRVIDPF